MKNSCISCFLNHPKIALVVLVLATAGAPCNRIEAQENPSLALSSNRIAVHPLKGDQPAGSETFVVDSASGLLIDILSSVEDLETVIVGPGGEVVNEATISSFGGTFSRMEGSEAGASPHLLGTPSEGFSYRYQMPSLGPGPYTVQFGATQPLLKDEAVLVDLQMESPVRVAMLSTQAEMTLGDPAVLSVAVFEGANPVVTAQVEAAVLNEADQLTTLQLLDDGGTFDEIAGDGLYSGSFTPAGPGWYRAVAEIIGWTVDNVEFQRQATTRFRVMPPLGWLQGSYSDNLVDDDGSGRPDRMVIGIDVEIIAAGDYGVQVRMQTQNGQTLDAFARKEVSVGPHQFTVSFEAEALRETGEDGPYAVRNVHLIRYSPAATDADQMTDLGVTQAYRIADLERPGLLLLGISREEPLDNDSNGLIDHLKITADIDSLHEGAYSWNATLRDSEFRQISRRKSGVTLAKGLNELEMVFEMTRIGLLRSDGPYEVPDLVVYHSQTKSPAFGSIMVEHPLLTQPYGFSEFETAHEVQVAAKPLSNEGHVKPGPGHLLTVAVLADETYDITTVNPWAFRMGPLDAGEAHREAHWKDFDRDGDLDLVLHFDAFAAQIQCGQEEVHVVGQFFDGRYLGGVTRIRTTGCK